MHDSAMRDRHVRSHEMHLLLTIEPKKSDSGVDPTVTTLLMDMTIIQPNQCVKLLTCFFAMGFITMIIALHNLHVTITINSAVRVEPPSFLI